MELNTQEANPEAGATPSVESVERMLPALDGQGGASDNPTEQTPAQADTAEVSAEGQPDQPELYDVEFTDETGAKVKKGLTLDELTKGYMQERDYRHKTETHARNVRDFQSATQQWSQQFFGQAQQRLQEIEMAMQVAIEDEFHGVNWEHLAQVDPEYNAKKERYNAKIARFNQVRQQNAEFKRQQHQQALQNFVVSLPAVMPDWSPRPDNPVNVSLTETALSLGFRPEEVASIVDPRIAVALREIYEFRKGKSQVTAAEKKVTEAAPVLRPQATSANKGATAQRQKAAIAKAVKSGNWQDLADALPPL